MKKALTLVLLVLISIPQIFSQKTTKIIVSEKTGNQKSTVVESSSPTKFNIKESIFNLTVITKPTKDGSYIEISGDRLMKTYNAGNPDLPVITKLIEIPANKTVKINIISFKEKQIKLADFNIKEQIIPAQESVSKSDDPDKVIFKKNKEIYTKNSFYKPEFVTFEDEGYLRNKHLGFIQISPFEYNPVTNILNVKYDFEIEIEFVSDNKSTIVIDERLQSPYFENLPIQTINSTADSKELIQGPVKYVIVSHEMFQSTLQPFIEWKRQKGFKVVEAYTNNPAVGTTTTTIKNYLQGLYDTPDDGTAPTFVLLVGDVAQIPTFSGNSASHVT
ncbi:MAG: C25 family peptidase propeptide domain-containing protein, partial [Bacteroidales bacterium]